MDSKSVYRKILRGGLTGIVIGIVGGIAIPTMMKWKTLVSHKDEIAKRFQGAVIETFASDIQLDVPDVECNDLEDVVLRFHVRANSNSDEDIALKMVVRDAVFEMLRQDLGSYNMDTAGYDEAGRDEVIEYMSEHLEEIEATALQTIQAYGYDYDVRAYISEDFFPMRQYGELNLPAGYYKALRVDIGKAQGENFWCLLYPTMCYTVDSVSFVSKEGEDKLEQALSEEDYDKLFVKKNPKKSEVKIKFKLLEWLGV